MTISKDKMVSVTYELKLDGKDGDVFEKAGIESPLVFLYGSGMMLPAFEQALLNKKVNDTFEISIACSGYLLLLKLQDSVDILER